MAVWYTSDWHFGQVAPDDVVWVAGDVALGVIEDSLACCAAMKGRKRLLLGNHDRPAQRPGKRDYWTERYRFEGGFEAVIDSSWIRLLFSAGQHCC